MNRSTDDSKRAKRSKGRDRPRAAAAIGPVEYELHTLGWYGFQGLSLTISREILGQDVTNFLDSRDAGRDGAWEGTWSRTAASEQFVLQCKHTAKKSYSLRFADLQPELEKAKKLVKDGRCDTYILMTNARVSGPMEQKLSTAFRNAGVKRFVCFGYTWICDTIRDNKRLRMLVPRVYGLGDLTQILDERAYKQAEALLVSMQEDLAKVVLTETYGKAARALEEHGFVLLLGAPAAGKTTVAALLALAAIDQWGSSTVKIDSPTQIPDRWNPEEPTQFFWIDDAFGTTQYEFGSALAWNRVLPQVSAAISGGAKVVMTSRDYIYNSARNDLKNGSFPLLNESQVVVDVQDLTIDERKQILYNHLRLGDQSRPFLTSIKPFLDEAAEHEGFMPETARRLSNPLFTEKLQPTREGILSFIEAPLAFLQEILLALDPNSRAALGLIYMSRGMLPSPLDLTPDQENALALLGATRAGVTKALEALRGSLVRQVTRDGTTGWIFKHPTITDAFSALVSESLEMVDIYLAGADVDRITREVTCRDDDPWAAYRPASLRVPTSRYVPLAERLILAAQLQPGVYREAVYRFLARRADRDFLQEVLSRWPDLLDSLSSPGLFLNAVAEVPLAITLQTHGLLPKEIGERFKQAVIEYALDGEDFAVVTDADFKVFFSDDEYDALVQTIRDQVAPNLATLVTRHLDAYLISDRSQEGLRGLAAPYLNDIDELIRVLPEDMDMGAALLAAERAIDEWIDQNHRPEEDAEADNTPTIVPDSVGESPGASELPDRSLFDDVDAK